MFLHSLSIRHLWGSQCLVCHSWPTQSVCEACVSQFAQPCHRCSTCALPLADGLTQCGACLTQPHPLDLCLTAVGYAFPWAHLIAAFKFQDQTALARSFAQLMRATPWVEPALEAADMVLPVPLSERRLKERGYNQSLLLAKALHPKKARSDLLLRIKDTSAQHTLGRKQRLSILHNAFAVEPLKVTELKGAHLVLIDDVMTTGASLYESARVLKAAGVTQVTAMVIARTK